MDKLHERLAALESRLARIEERLGLTQLPAEPGVEGAEAAMGQAPDTALEKDQDDLEFEVGQNWFARVGIVVLALGITFLLTFPYANLPPAAPGLFGYVLAGGLFLLARVLRISFDLVSRYLRGAGMLLLFFTTLRLFYFGPEPVLGASSVAGMALLVAVLVLNVTVALHRKSPYLFGLALVTGFATSVAVGTTWFVLPLIALLCALSVYASLRNDWTWVLFCCSFFAYLAHLLWAVNDPVIGNPVGFLPSPHVSVYFLPGYAVIVALGVLLRPNRGQETFSVISTSFLNGGLCYGVFLLHTTGAFYQAMVPDHLLASAVFLGLAIAFWIREGSQYSTFAYAMLGYLALSVAIIKSFAVPGVFVWLSVQSLVVVATAIWFRSRFIVVANFVIYLLIIAGYTAVAKEESGISLGFGVVALASARILNWKQDRLALKTEMMRNAYLASAFVVFPYALYHLVPRAYVSLSWVGIAGFYYLMNLIVRKQKYRWMGHLTLILTVLYVVIIGISQLEPAYRIVSFLVLGTVLLVVSLVFTRIRSRKRAGEEGEKAAGERLFTAVWQDTPAGTEEQLSIFNSAERLSGEDQSFIISIGGWYHAIHDADDPGGLPGKGGPERPGGLCPGS